METNNLTVSTSRRENYHDNACADFLALLKMEWIDRIIYRAREEGKAGGFIYIELFYDLTRRYGISNDVSPMEFDNNIFVKQ